MANFDLHEVCNFTQVVQSKAISSGHLCIASTMQEYFAKCKHMNSFILVMPYTSLSMLNELAAKKDPRVLAIIVDMGYTDHTMRYAVGYYSYP